MENELEKIILAYPEKPWEFSQLAENPNLTLKIIRKFPLLNWSIEDLVKNKKIMY